MAKRNLANNDDFITSILDTKVLEALAKALGPVIAQSIEASISKKIEDLGPIIAHSIEVSLTKRIEDLTVSVKVLKDSNDALVKTHDCMERELRELRARVRDSEVRIEEVELYSRGHDVIVRGLAENTHAQRAHPSSDPNSAAMTMTETSTVLEDAIVDMCNNQLGLTVQRQDISVAHRLRASAKDRVRPVIVRFTSRRVRDEVFRAKRELRNLPRDRAIFISEHLTKAASSLFFEARKLQREKKITATWTAHGLVNVKKTENAAERPTIVRTSADLEAFVAPGQVARPLTSN
jgi:hypothetical protein